VDRIPEHTSFVADVFTFTRKLRVIDSLQILAPVRLDTREFAFYLPIFTPRGNRVSGSGERRQILLSHMSRQVAM